MKILLIFLVAVLTTTGFAKAEDQACSKIVNLELKNYRANNGNVEIGAPVHSAPTLDYTVVADDTALEASLKRDRDHDERASEKLYKKVDDAQAKADKLPLEIQKLAA